jgi:hypothetical protein
MPETEVSYGLPVDHLGFPALDIDRTVNIDAHQRSTLEMSTRLQ